MRNKAFEKLISKGLSKARYRHPEVCRRDLVSVLHSFRGLAPDFDRFVFDDGDEKNLVNVNGTIPVTYRGNTYNIPVCFWLTPEYPESAPIAFVRPTPDMQVKASAGVVSLSGQITLPYVEEWRPPEANLLELVQLCVVVFGQTPPVFSKGKSSAIAQPSVIALPRSHPSTTSLPSSSRSTEQVAVLHRQASLQDQSHEDHFVMSEKHLRASLLTAAEEKVRSRLGEEFMKTRAEMESLQATNRELQDGQEKLSEMMTQLQDASSELDSYSAKLMQAEVELSAELQTLLGLSQVDLTKVDEFVEISGGSCRQAVESHAQDTAIEDCLYWLGRALHQDAIECEVYLKKVRNLSRVQFFHRSILIKCEEKLKREEKETASIKLRSD